MPLLKPEENYARHEQEEIHKAAIRVINEFGYSEGICNGCGLYRSLIDRGEREHDAYCAVGALAKLLCLSKKART